MNIFTPAPSAVSPLTAGGSGGIDPALLSHLGGTTLNQGRFAVIIAITLAIMGGAMVIMVAHNRVIGAIALVAVVVLTPALAGLVMSGGLQISEPTALAIQAQAAVACDDSAATQASYDACLKGVYNTLAGGWVLKDGTPVPIDPMGRG